MTDFRKLTWTFSRMEVKHVCQPKMATMCSLQLNFQSMRYSDLINFRVNYVSMTTYQGQTQKLEVSSRPFLRALQTLELMY